MKKSSVILFVVMASLTSCAINKEKEMAKESAASVFQPKPLDDEWSKWIVGEWEGSAESDIGEFKNWVKAKVHTKIELSLNGQFLIKKSKAEITHMSPEYIQHLKETMHASDEDIEKIKSSTFKELQVHTIDLETGEVIGYLFDSLRCIAKGRGRREGNKETMEWEWSGTGQGASSIRITEKVSDNKIIVTEKYTLPDGSIMEDKGEMTRVKETAEK